MLDDLYQKVILDHNKNPSNYGVLDKHTYMAEGRNPLCGDQLTVYLNLNSDNTIEDISFEAKECAISVASASIMSEVVKGKSVDDAETIKNTEIATELSLPPVKIHCSILAEDAIKAAVADYKKKSSKSSIEVKTETL